MTNCIQLPLVDKPYTIILIKLSPYFYPLSRSGKPEESE